MSLGQQAPSQSGRWELQAQPSPITLPRMASRTHRSREIGRKFQLLALQLISRVWGRQLIQGPELAAGDPQAVPMTTDA